MIYRMRFQHYDKTKRAVILVTTRCQNNLAYSRMLVIYFNRMF